MATKISYQQGRALAKRIIEKLESIAETRIQARQKKFDNDPAHAKVVKLNVQIKRLKSQRADLVNKIKKDHAVTGYTSDEDIKKYVFKSGALVPENIRQKIMDDLTIYTIGTDKKIISADHMIDDITKKYEGKV